MNDCFRFEAIRGIQAGREFFVVMCPLRQIPKLFLFAEEELPAELRAQRTLSRTRVPKIARYIVANPTEYVFSSLTASVDAEMQFEPLGTSSSEGMGYLSIPLSARIVINDGQHRRAAIEEALREAPQLGTENISVVFFQDLDLSRCQQMFADLNRHATKPTKSLGILYDHRDVLAQLTRRLIRDVPTFKDLTETEKTSISNRSTKLFTLNSLYQATDVLLRRANVDPSQEEAYAVASTFWAALGTTIKDWERVRHREVSSALLRSNFVHAHGVSLQALGRVGGDLINTFPIVWKQRLNCLAALDWSRTNAQLWEGRALVDGRITKGQRNIILIGNVIKSVMKLPLDPEEKRAEQRFGNNRALQLEAIL